MQWRIGGKKKNTLSSSMVLDTKQQPDSVKQGGVQTPRGSEADFDVFFRTARVTCCTDEVKFVMEKSTPPCQI